MGVRLGYLLPTREQVMAGHFEARSLLDLASRAAVLGFHAIWVGDSLLARPRHDPLTLLAAVAARLPTVQLGTAVLLPALRNPVLLAQQVATIDQIAEGRLILGVSGPNLPPPACPSKSGLGACWKASASVGRCGPAGGSIGTAVGRWRGVSSDRCRIGPVGHPSGWQAHSPRALSASAGFSTAGYRTRPRPRAGLSSGRGSRPAPVPPVATQTRWSGRCI
jgi:Luciferase-like monooxygenase